MNDGLIINADSAGFLQAVTSSLMQRGLYLVRSFDLRSALANHSGCECPHHGPAECSCQYVVLLIYGNAAEPVVLTIHSQAGRTSARIVRDVAPPLDPQLAEDVLTGLFEAALAVQTALARPASVELNSHG